MLKSLHDKFRKQQNASKKDMLKNSNKNDSLNLSLNDCMCPICLEIFIEPVRMPCKHEICLNCFETMLDKTNLCCPMCRLRISTWARQATNNNTLVDIKRWQSIQNRFPDEIDKRLTGKSREDVENTLGKTVQASKQDIHFAHDGEIRKEFLEFMKRVCACNYLYTAWLSWCHDYYELANWRPLMQLAHWTYICDIRCCLWTKGRGTNSSWKRERGNA